MSSILAAQGSVPIGSITATLTGSAKVTSSIGVDALPKGKYLVGVQPVRSGTVTTACRAGIYVRVFEVMNAGSTPLRVLWSGYLRDGNTPASIPNIRARAATSYVMQAWALAAYNGESVTVNLVFDDMPAGGTYIHREAPGEGPGQLQVVSLGDPAAGAEYSTQTVPACERWRLRSFSGTLTASATVASRVPRITYDDGTNAFAGASAPSAVTATQAVTERWGPNVVAGTASTAIHTAPLPDVFLSPAFRFSFTTSNLDAGDNWSAGYAQVEKWVMPDG